MNLLAWIAILVSVATSAGELVGKRIPPYPYGLEDMGGACIGSTALGTSRACDYSIGILGDGGNESRVIFGARNVGRNDQGKAIWEITDAMPYPSLSPNQAVVIATCTDGGESDEAIFAAVQVTDTEWFEKLVWARRYELDTGAFIEHPVSEVRCYNESWGL